MSNTQDKKQPAMELAFNVNLFKARSFEQLFTEHNIDIDLAMKLQALPLVNIIDGYVDMGDGRLLEINDFIDSEFGEFDLKTILHAILKLREIRLINEQEVKRKFRFVRAVCANQPVQNEDGTNNIFMLPQDAADFLNKKLEVEGKNFRVDVETYQKNCNNAILFDETSLTYYFVVDAIKDPISEEEFEKLWKDTE